MEGFSGFLDGGAANRANRREFLEKLTGCCGWDEMRPTMERMTLATRLLVLMAVAFLPGCQSAVPKGRAMERMVGSGDRSAAFRGRADALADLKAGKLVVESFGMPGPASGEYTRLLEKRYGIETRRVGAGCVFTPDEFQHAQAYNRVMKAEISRRFGPDVFELTYQEAAKR